MTRERPQTDPKTSTDAGSETPNDGNPSDGNAGEGNSGESRAERLRRAILKKKAQARSRSSDQGSSPPGEGASIKAGSSASSLPRRPADHPPLLGEMQRGLWLAHQLEPNSPAYHLVSAFQVHGDLDLPRLEQALATVVARHRILSSTFRSAGSAGSAGSMSSIGAGGAGVLQEIQQPFRPSVERLEAPTGGGAEAALEWARQPMDLELGPLLRAGFMQEQAQEEQVGGQGGERLLVLVLHHILADERSLGILWRELDLAFVGRLDSAPPPLQYDDWADAQRQSPRHAARRAEALEFWRQRLDPPPLPLQLPFDRRALGRPTLGPRDSGDQGPLPLGMGRLLLGAGLAQPVVQRLRQRAAEAGTTPFVILAFAFHLLLHRVAEMDDDDGAPAFAIPVSTRTQAATAEMIGYFTNPVVVRAQLDESQSVGQALAAFRRPLESALAHASISFQDLVDALPSGSGERSPFFQGMFVHQTPPPSPRLGAARLEPRLLDLRVSKFDFTLFVAEGQDALTTALEFRADRFDEERMGALLTAYETLLEHLTEPLQGSSEVRLASLSMLRVAERKQLRALARGAEPRQLPEELLPQQILHWARRVPRAAAVFCDGRRLDYGELGRGAGAVARELRERGVGAGDRVGLFLPRSPEMIIALVGILWSGAAYVPLDPAYPAARTRDVLEDAEVAAVVSGGETAGELPAGSWILIRWEQLSLLGEEELSRGNVAAVAEPSAPAYLLYTSGSTGRPKGVVVTHDNLRWSTGVRQQVYGRPPARFLLASSIAFDSSVAGLFWTLSTGGALVIPTEAEATDPRRLVRRIEQHQVRALLCVPSLYAGLLEARSTGLGEMDTAIVAGESCPAELVREHARLLPGVRLFNEYGPTEATVWATAGLLATSAPTPDELAELEQGVVTIGRPIPAVTVDLLDDQGRSVPVGLPGEAWISGPTVAAGYWRREELTEEKFPRAEGGPEEDSIRRYRTGDRMIRLADGRLLFLGRLDGQLKIRGHRIEAGEVEAALLRLPGVVEAVAVARGAALAASASGADARLVAFVRGSAEELPPVELLNSDFRRRLAQRLPHPMIPSRIVVLEDLPRLPNGKVNRRELRQLTLPEEAGDQPRRIPSTEEQILISLWEGLLGRSGIGPEDNFFELGGHSLLVAEMTAAIERDFEVALDSTDVFESPTIAELARRIEARAQAQPGAARREPYLHLFPVQTRGEGMPLVMAIPHFFSEMLASRFRGERPVYGLRGVSLRAEGNRGRWPTMEALASNLVEEIDRRFPGERVLLAGYSFGGSMAVEAARILEARGIPAHRLFLIAPMALDRYPLGPFSLQLDGADRPPEEFSLSEAASLYARNHHPLTRRPYARLKRRLVIQPRRRLRMLEARWRKWRGQPLTPAILYADVRLERFRLHAQYRPGVLHTPTVFFDAREAETRAAATWRSRFAGPLTVHEIPDPHLGEEAAEAARQEILRLFDRYLPEAEETQQGTSDGADSDEGAHGDA
ncbi:MAG: amino acid adenylation domain-containing protein [Acidobacteriota bacterium]